MRIGLFIPCYIDAFFPEVGIATLELLERFGHDVEYPHDQTRFGQPMANSGFSDHGNHYGSVPTLRQYRQGAVTMATAATMATTAVSTDTPRHDAARTEENSMQTLQADYFAAYRNLKLSRDDKGVPVAEFHSDGGPFTMNAQAHTEFVDAFHRIGQDRANKIVIVTGAGGNFIGDVEWPSFGDVADPGFWSRIHDEGVQTLENIANIRVPVIAAVEGRAHIHSDYALLASVIVAAEGATFQDVGHFAVGVTPGDGIFTTWSYRAGAGRAEAFLLNPQPLPARTAHEWGVVAEVVPNGKAVVRAQELANLYLQAPEVTRRNTRIHFIQPLKERIVREVGYGLSLEGASLAELVKSKQSKT